MRVYVGDASPTTPPRSKGVPDVSEPTLGVEAADSVVSSGRVRTAPVGPHTPSASCRKNKHCTSLECIELLRQYQRRQYIRAIMHGHARKPAGPVRAHLIAMHQESGISYHAIAAALGMSADNVRRIAKGTTKTVTAETAAKILAHNPAKVATVSGYVDATVTRRQLQSLAVLGWTHKWIATQLGLKHSSHVSHMLVTDKVYPRTAESVAALVARVGIDGWGPSTLARNRALARGWQPPAYWDNWQEPEPLSTEREPSEGLANRRETVERMTRQNYSARDIARVLGYTGKDEAVGMRTVQRHRRALGLVGRTAA